MFHRILKLNNKIMVAFLKISSNKYFIVLLIIQINSLNAFSIPFWENLINSTLEFQNQNYETQEIFFKSIYNSANISAECKSSILEALEALKNLDDWSYQMYNSWGKFPPSGIIEGTVTDFGDYDQCLAIKPNEVIGESQYCLIDISLPLPKPMPIHQNFYHKVNVLPKFMNKSENNVFIKLSEDASYFYWFYIRLGICTPNKCNQNDVKAMAKKSESLFIKLSKITIYFVLDFEKFGLILKDLNCESQSIIKLNFTQIFAM
jgi:hypothetical protein